MKILMIHGIGQEETPSDKLPEKWLKCLSDVAPALVRKADTRMAYYGTTLADCTAGKVKNAVGMGLEGTEVDIGDEGELKFLSAALEEVADQQDLTDADIDQAAGGEGHAIPMDNFIARRLVGLVRALEKISPAKGALFLRVIRQGHTYLNSPRPPRQSMKSSGRTFRRVPRSLSHIRWGSWLRSSCCERCNSKERT